MMGFRSDYLDRLRRESDHALVNRNEISPDLRDLAYLARTASPRTKSIKWRGIRFQGFVINSVLDPDTGRPLVGALAI